VTIADLIVAPIPKSPRVPRTGSLTELATPRALRVHTLPGRFEHRVFRYLVEQRQALGIERVFEAKNLLVDGTIVLADGRCLVVEAKYRMGWLKACQVGWQVEGFLRMPDGQDCRPVGALVVFETFSGDWAKSRKDRKIETGWSHWYSGHATLPGRPGFRLDLIRLRRGRFEGYPR